MITYYFIFKNILINERGRDIFTKLPLKKLILMSKIYAGENPVSVLTSTESQIKCYSKSQTVRTELATRNDRRPRRIFSSVSGSIRRNVGRFLEMVGLFLFPGILQSLVNISARFIVTREKHLCARSMTENFINSTIRSII